MLWLSALVVFGTLGWVLSSLGDDTSLRFGFEQLIHARIPWLVLGALWGGAGLGVYALWRRKRWLAVPIVAFELIAAGYLSWYVIAGSTLPPSTLAVAAGEPFPSYSLVDHDGTLRTTLAGTPREPALYVFYRGDW